MRTAARTLGWPKSSFQSTGVRGGMHEGGEEEDKFELCGDGDEDGTTTRHRTSSSKLLPPSHCCSRCLLALRTDAESSGRWRLKLMVWNCREEGAV